MIRRRGDWQESQPDLPRQRIGKSLVFLCGLSIMLLLNYPPKTAVTTGNRDLRGEFSNREVR